MADLLICRACLACRVPVYNILNTRYHNVFERIAVISLVEQNRPHALCAPCLQTLHGFCRLLEKSKISEGILSRLQKQNKLTESSIKAVNRQHYNLADTLPSFTLEPMKPSREQIKKKTKNLSTSSPKSVSLEHLSPSQPHLPNVREAKKLYSNFDYFETQKLEGTATDIMVKIEPGEPQTLEDTRDVKDESGEQSCADPRSNVSVEVGLSQSSEITDNIVVKIEQDVQEYLIGVAEPAINVFTEKPSNKSNHKISIETVKFQEKPYIQIDAGKLITNIKPEVDNNKDNTNKTSNMSRLDNDKLMEIDVEMNKHINDDFGAVKDENHAIEHVQASSSKGIKDLAEREKDGRRVKTVSSKCLVLDEPKTANQKNRPSKSYHCNKCDYNTPFKKRLMYHMKKHVGYVICAICDYKCATKSRLVSHLRVHTRERPYKCKECNKVFSEVGTLSKHMNIHNGVKPYKCMWCNYEAASKNHLDRHIKRHIGDKRFKCELCEYACVQKWDLKRHAKTHDNERTRSYKRVAPVIIKSFSVTEKSDN